MEITKVQQWVVTALAFTMGMISSTCMAGYSVWSDTLAENGNAPGLWAMGAVVGVLTIVIGGSSGPNGCSPLTRFRSGAAPP